MAKKRVCSECGSDQVQVKVWIDPNTHEVFDEIGDDVIDFWCDNCNDHVFLTEVENE